MHPEVREGSLLIEASIGGHETMVRVLLENGAGVNVRNNSNWTALIYASRGGRKAIVRLLLDEGAKVDVKGYGGAALKSASSGGI